MDSTRQSCLRRQLTETVVMGIVVTGIVVNMGRGDYELLSHGYVGRIGARSTLACHPYPS